jgi:hypothetical protein
MFQQLHTAARIFQLFQSGAYFDARTLSSYFHMTVSEVEDYLNWLATLTVITYWGQGSYALAASLGGPRQPSRWAKPNPVAFAR